MYDRIILRLVLFVCVLAACNSAESPVNGAGSSTSQRATAVIADATPADAPADAAVRDAPAAVPPFGLLAKDRGEFATRIVRQRPSSKEPPPVPPSSTKLERVKYRAPLGEMWAYVSQDPKDGKQHPAVIWAGGGIALGIGKRFFERAAWNDQSAIQLRAAGIVVLYPSYRGDHDNPGTYEMLFGEVDDYLAAAEHLRNLSYVDPNRVFFAGHSTGGTLALLAAEMTDRFRAAFVFGPVTGAKSYGESIATFDRTTPDAAKEWQLRAPLHYLGDIRRPTLVIEGAKSPNARALPGYARAAAAARVPVTTREPENLDHFSVLAPELRRLARKIAADDGKRAFRW
jgi:acetyl esterase/lipase